ncbi:thrombospondin type 3 repeat-containing protein [Solimonas sp. SE-A11]|uniref:thrombospondin type 3 repeat-containing protein n=1 Tax=Solimonas sp. SE-A11 TaxID=3054954 RepID=UPI00259CF055|nr:thrombospondin type 3 repeat-containing protein [Solimonas sp. SE-A11]MDM4771757.1 thrombospondin type 3 repeat-containing protein [Solimonas sp. SE-A11]
MFNKRLGAALKSAAVIGATAAAMLSTSANAYEPGWYFGLSGSYSAVEDSDGTLNTSITSTTPATPGSQQNCLLQALPGLGPLLNGAVGGLGVQGCLLTLLGPGTTTPGTPGSTNTQRLAPARAQITFDGGYSIAGSLGYLFDGGFRPELSLAISENDVDGSRVNTQAGAVSLSNDGKLTTARLMANAWYDFDFGSSIIPYVGVGAGFQQSDLDLKSAGLSDKASGLVYQAGAGVGFVLSDATTLSLDYRYVVGDDMEASGQSPTAADGSFTSSTLESEYKAQTIGLSLRRSFGGTPTDSDGDGVPDRLDKCPNTPKGVTVYSDGCPVDTDGDGVPDYLDKCPGTPKGTAVDANGCPADSDGDGVPDSLDKCPGTPRGVMVGPDGCPIDSDGDGIPDAYDKCPNTPKGVIVGPDGCPAADADGDGVPDFMDKCPETPRGVAVGPDGCPLDSDGDGIPDYLDECPRSPPGAKVLPNGCALTGDCRKPRPGEAVDANGCALDKNFILRGVKFEFDSDRLTEPAKLILNEVAETLKAYPTIKVDLEGHTDNVGTDAYNLGLSERRANSVKTYLAGRGIEAPRMNPVGYGESRPIDTNDTEEGREENRRVELKVIE